MGRIEIELGDRTDLGRCARRAWRACSASRIFVRGPRAARLRALAAAILARSRRSAAGVVSRAARARGQAAAVHLAADRARGRRPDQGRDGLARRSRAPDADDSHRDADRQAFYYFGKEPGAGGLPTGTGGRVACLLSGGIDSPVAAYRMMRRGCSRAARSISTAIRSCRARRRRRCARSPRCSRGYQLRSRLLLVPFGELQQQVCSPSRPSCASSSTGG